MTEVLSHKTRVKVLRQRDQLQTMLRRTWGEIPGHKRKELTDTMKELNDASAEAMGRDDDGQVALVRTELHPTVAHLIATFAYLGVLETILASDDLACNEGAGEEG